MKEPQTQLDQPRETPQEFWRLLNGRILPEDWSAAIRAARSCLSGLPVAEDGTPDLELMKAVQQEQQFGADHWQLSPSKRVYYRCVRPWLPASIRPFFRTLFLARQKYGFPLKWPVEDRLVRFQFELVRCLLESKKVDSVPYLHFWLAGKRFALVLTHDIETYAGLQFVRQVAALEESCGFRSSFNFVPQGYPVDPRLIQELKARGFEVGVHGLKHDGSLFSSYGMFLDQSRAINRTLKDWGATGFRAPFTHRNPEWMQALEIEYDSSFFDTDPYEPIPGGTLTIWPFQMGHFIELPYTLAQDHTLMVTLGETTPRIWLEKVAFIRQHCGMALVNTHPDYLKDPRHFSIYQSFLETLRNQADIWNALPVEAARWWRARAAVDADEVTEPGATDRQDAFAVWWIQPAGDHGIRLEPGPPAQVRDETCEIAGAFSSPLKKIN